MRKKVPANISPIIPKNIYSLLKNKSKNNKHIKSKIIYKSGKIKLFISFIIKNKEIQQNNNSLKYNIYFNLYCTVTVSSGNLSFGDTTAIYPFLPCKWPL